MAYLLDLISPGAGHLAARRWRSGGALLALWLMSGAAAYVAMSFQVWAFLALPALWALLSLVAVVDLIRVRRQLEGSRPGCLRALLLAPLGPALAVIVGLVVSNAVVRPLRVRSGSMTPAAVTGDVILAQMFAPLIFGVHLGDIVLVADPRHAGRLLIKRILGVAGDLIEIRGGVLRRNGRPLAECELRSLRDHETRQLVHERLEVLDGRPYLVWDQPAVRSLALTTRVAQGQLFVVGDNRDRSGDSRTFGTVPVDSVRAVVTARVWPVLTNEIYRAPIKARQAAYRRCRGGQNRADGGAEGPTDQGSTTGQGGQGTGARWPSFRTEGAE